MTPKKGAIVGASCGFLVGCIMVFFVFGRSPATDVCGILSYPAMLLAQGFSGLWRSLGLGPHGDAGFAVPILSMVVAVVAQWTLLGLVLGLLLARRHPKLVGAIGGATGLAALGVVLWLVVLPWLFMDPTEAHIRKMGGQVGRAVRTPGKPIISVDLAGSQVTDAGLEALRGLSELRQLMLYSCPNVSANGLQNIKGLKQLTTIGFYGSDATDAWLAQIEGLTQLRTLRLQGCFRITDAGLAHLKGLTNLETLDIARCDQVTDAGLAHLKGLTNLETLDIEHCDQVTDAGLTHLRGLTHLKNLVLYEAGISDAGLAHLRGLTQLERLNLDQCSAVADDGLKHLKGLTNLKSLSLSGTNVSDAAIQDLRAAIPHLDASGFGRSHVVRRRPDRGKEQGGPAEQEKADDVITACRKAIELNPADFVAYYRLGVALAERRRPAEAMTSLRKALALKPDDAEAHYQLGLVLAELGRPSEAVSEYRMALRLKPDYEEARQRLRDSVERKDKRR